MISTGHGMLVFGIGMYHPVPGNDPQAPPGYDLTADQLDTMDLVGLSMTLEHAGLAEGTRRAVSRGDGAETLGKRLTTELHAMGQHNATVAVVGTVLGSFRGREGAYYAVYVLDSTKYPVPALFATTLWAGLSLTHSDQHDVLEPLELTITTRPARHGCFTKVVGDLRTVDAYKRGLGVWSSPAMEPAQTPITIRAQLEKVLEQLDEGQRSVIMAGYAHLQGQQKTAAPVAPDPNTKQLQLMLNNLEHDLRASTKEVHNITTDTCSAAAASATPAVQAFLPFLTAASAEIRLLKTEKQHTAATAGASYEGALDDMFGNSNKRARVDDPPSSLKDMLHSC